MSLSPYSFLPSVSRSLPSLPSSRQSSFALLPFKSSPPSVQLGGQGSAVSSYSFKIWHLVATNFMIILRSNLRNFVHFKQYFRRFRQIWTTCCHKHILCIFYSTFYSTKRFSWKEEKCVAWPVHGAPARGSGEHCKLPSGLWGWAPEAQR